MATPTSLPAAVATGDTGTAAQFNGLRGAFRILQVVSATYSTQAASTSALGADTGLTVTITPQSSSSKIFVVAHHLAFGSTALTETSYSLLRNGTGLQTQLGALYSSAGASTGPAVFMYLDSPATTSAVVYKTQFARTAGGGISYTQINSTPANITVFEVSA